MKRYPALDGLRGIAIIAVIACHVNWAFGGPFTLGRINGPVAMILGWGWVGVDLFFVVSGFLITGILIDAKEQPHYFRNFYIRRTLRIMPLYFGFLFLTIAIIPRLSALICKECALSRPDILSLGLYFYNFRVAFTHHALGIFHPFWSLSVEEHFYFVWPLIVWAAGSRILMRVCLAGIVLSLILRCLVLLSGAWPLSAFFFTPCRLDGLLAGAMVALAWRDRANWRRVQGYAGSLVLGSGSLLLGLALGQGHFIPDRNGELVLTIGLTLLATFFAGSLALVLDRNNSPRFQRICEGTQLRSIGKYSYAIYVFHSFLLSMIMRLVSVPPYIPTFLIKVIFVLSTLAVSFAAAWLSYHVYEKHFLQLKRFFEYEPSCENYALAIGNSPQGPS